MTGGMGGMSGGTGGVGGACVDFHVFVNDLIATKTLATNAPESLNDKNFCAPIAADASKYSGLFP